MKNADYRLSIYTSFAQKAKTARLKWVVAHGSEGYPNTIGRDLDCLCFDQDNIKKAIDLFKKTSVANNQTKWIIEPNQIWGKRVLAISENYEVAELHILWKLNSGLIDYEIDWNQIDNNLFPHNEGVSAFKSIVMPILGGSKKVLNNESLKETEIPYALSRILDKIKSNTKITLFDKFLAYISIDHNPIHLIRNMRYSQKVASQIPYSATTPIVLILSDNEIILKKIQENLNEIFLDFINGDSLTSKEIIVNQSRQRLVYFTKPRKDVKIDFEIKNYDQFDLNSLVSAFWKFNLGNENA